jgi:hypothetical protein
MSLNILDSKKDFLWYRYFTVVWSAGSYACFADWDVSDRLRITSVCVDISNFSEKKTSTVINVKIHIHYIVLFKS